MVQRDGLKLPNFYFLCGILGHGEHKCPQRYERVLPIQVTIYRIYGAWMRVPSDKENLTTRQPLQPSTLGNRMKDTNGVQRISSPSIQGENVFNFSSHTNTFQRKSTGKENESEGEGSNLGLVNNPIQFIMGSGSKDSARKKLSVTNKGKKE
ncbi:hypothetical protein ACP275_09G048800 [Erythranthe tilingii]